MSPSTQPRVPNVWPPSLPPTTVSQAPATDLPSSQGGRGTNVRSGFRSKGGFRPNSQSAGAANEATESDVAGTTSTASKDQRTLHKALSNYCGFIQVHVGQGDELESFAVHQALITARSQFFRAALSGNWVESKERTVRLPEDDPNTFHIYVHFLYTNEIAVLTDSDSKTISMGNIDNVRLAKLYVLAEKLQDTETKDRVLQTVIVAYKPGTGSFFMPKLPNHGFVRIIYEGTPSGSLARKLVVSMYARRAKGTWFKLEKASNRMAWPEDFIHELLIDVMNQRAVLPGAINAEEACTYKELRAGS